ncbi:MAG TPA: SDR family NAD(P)-dependent oxidoreductase [Solirubrobacteraceae bacterium]|jgi:short-subunit dehydrogenase|nr:SDR family NAD(P)-dependent oxidoreductase [Solirubrobacteraceae bacterium]
MAFVALVTGASAGIGAATARRLAREPGARLVLVARRGDRLQALAEELGGATVIAADLTDPDAPARVRKVVESEHGELHLLVNNAGASWRGRFGEAGWPNVERHLRLDFEAPVRLTEALLPLLRASAAAVAPPSAPPSAEAHRAAVSIVNVASTAGRVARPGAAAYSAAKFALAGWTDGLHLEERQHGIHVGLVLPGFVKTEGFPTTELLASAATRWMVSTPEAVAEAIVQTGPGGRAERYVPRFYWIFGALRILAPRLVRRATAGGAFTTTTGHN